MLPPALPDACVPPICTTGAIFCAFCNSFLSTFWRVKFPQGVIWVPSPHLVLTNCEFWPHCIEGRLIRPSVVNWPHTLLIIANSLTCFFCFFVLSLSHIFSMSRGEQYLASHFMDLRSAFPGWMWVNICRSPLGGIAKGRDREGEIKVCQINSSLCESAYHHRERQWRDPPRHKKMSSKCWHYRQCHLFLNRDPSTGLCHPPIKVHYWSIYKEVYTLLNSTVKY